MKQEATTAPIARRNKRQRLKLRARPFATRSSVNETADNRQSCCVLEIGTMVIKIILPQINYKMGQTKY